MARELNPGECGGGEEGDISQKNKERDFIKAGITSGAF